MINREIETPYNLDLLDSNETTRALIDFFSNFQISPDEILGEEITDEIEAKEKLGELAQGIKNGSINSYKEVAIRLKQVNLFVGPFGGVSTEIEDVTTEVAVNVTLFQGGFTDKDAIGD